MRREFAMVRRSVLLALILLAPVQAHAARTDAVAGTHVGGLRLPFIENQGQVDAQVAYYAPAYDGTFFVTRWGQLVYSLPPQPADAPGSGPRLASGPGWTVTETLIGGRPRPAAQDPSATGVSYFIGADPALWRPRVPTYEQVGLGEVWPGVEVALRARGRGIEKVFTVAPGASVDRIRIRVSGARAFSVSADGMLVARTGLGDIAFTAPVAYQERDGARLPVQVAYRSEGREYGFTVAAYDPLLPLVIDPRLQSTYLGGSGDDAATALGIHPTSGEVYAAGSTTSTNFPGTPGGAQPVKSGNRDAFVARLNSALTSLLQVTFFGGSGDDGANALSIYPTSGDVYVAGSTTSTNLPNTAGGAQAANAGNGDAFVAQLNAALTGLFQTSYFGNSSTDVAAALAIDPTNGDVYVGGSRSSFPGCGNSTGFVARLNVGLTQLLTQASLGVGLVRALAFHPITGEVFAAGSADSGLILCAVRAFVKSLDDSLTVTGSIELGSGNFGDFASANALAIDPDSGDVYTAGAADSRSLPGTVGGAQSSCIGLCAFVARLSSDLTSLIQATFFGNSFLPGDGASALSIHPTTGDVYVGGTTSDPDLPGTTGGLQPDLSGNHDAFIARLTNSLAALFQATYLGHLGLDIASALKIHPTTGDVYVAGSTSPLLFPNEFPGTAGGAQPSPGGGSDAFVALMTPTLALVDPPAGPDLTLTKAHPGDFTIGQVGVYTITVSNVGTAATAGIVTVTDALPAGLTATALDGPGWSCTLGTLTCTRADALANGDTYPPITLTVTVAAIPPAINTATVSGGGDINLLNNVATDPTTVVSFFVDVSPLDPFAPFIDALFASGITAGCDTNPPRYCPELKVTRGEMAVFVERGIHGAAFVPPPAVGIFLDVLLDHPFVGFIEALFNEGITGGCNAIPLLYCSFENVTRAQMTVFLLRAIHGPGFVPPPATGVFADTVGHPLVDWIEAFFAEGITSGCGTGPLRFCPDEDVTRGQMAVFLVKAFGLPF